MLAYETLRQLTHERRHEREREAQAERLALHARGRRQRRRRRLALTAGLERALEISAHYCRARSGRPVTMPATLTRAARSGGERRFSTSDAPGLERSGAEKLVARGVASTSRLGSRHLWRMGAGRGAGSRACRAASTER